MRWFLVVVVALGPASGWRICEARELVLRCRSFHFPRCVLWLPSLHGPEFEQRVALGFGEVLLWRVVDAYSS